MADYYVSKLTMMIKIILVVIILTVCARLYSHINHEKEFDGTIARNGYGSNSKTVGIEGIIQNKNYPMEVIIAPREYSVEELEQLYLKFVNSLPSLILGENPNLEQISSNLVLREYYDEYPFRTIWNSADIDVIDNSGCIIQQNANTSVKLSVKILYEALDFERDYSMKVKVNALKMSEEELIAKQLLQKVVKVEEETRQQDSIKLPSEINGISVEWAMADENNFSALPILGVIAAVLIYFAADIDLSNKVKERQGIMRREYPEFVHKLLLYVNSGMSVKNAMIKVTHDYELYGRIQETNRKVFLEELKGICFCLENGMSESMAYERLGRIMGTIEYIRLGSILTQNLQKGNQMLCERLRIEADKAYEEQILSCRKMGEEASTKLLLPMVLMLLVVMLIIIVPAFWMVNV